PKGQKRPADVIGNAVKIARIATGEDADDTAEIEAVELEEAMAHAAAGGALELDVAAETYERLISANWHLRQHFEQRWRARLDTAPLEAGMVQISTELAKRRERGELPAPPRYGVW